MGLPDIGHLGPANPLMYVRVWPFDVTELGRLMHHHGYRLAHIASSLDGDKGRDLIYDTVWVLA